MIDYTKLSSYNYNLPEELIAQTPAEPRDSSRLLAFNIKTKKVEHKYFRDIINYLRAGDVLVLNNTRVVPCRLIGKKNTGAKVEIFLLKRLNLTDWVCLAKPGKRLKKGSCVAFGENFSCEILDEKEDIGGKIVRFSFEGSFESALDKCGSMPLPPYIKKKLENSERYQTVYSKIKGSSAAPTAGLHFTQELLEKIKEKGVTICEVLLHVGLGTFRPVKENDITKHDIHSEYFEVTSDVANTINKAKQEGRRIIAVGTTSVRTLESAGQSGKVIPIKGETKLFCYPPYKFKIVDCLITNFHLPESTLIMLVSAFAGYENTMNVYKIAVEEKYRFFSFGDSCFFYNE